MALFLEKYDTLAAFEKSFERPMNDAFKDETLSSVKISKDFSGTKSFDDAVNQLKTGRPEIIADLKKDAQVVDMAKTGTRIYRKNAFSGYAPNVARALAGLPRDMRKKYKVPQPAKTAVLVYSCTSSACVSQKDLDNAGRAFFRLAYRMEQSGVKTKIFVLPYAGETHSKKTTCCCMVKLKDFAGRFDLTRLSFPLTSPSMLRRFGFRFLETVKGMDDKSFCFSYGAVLDKSETFKILSKRPECGTEFKLFYPYDFINVDFDESKALENIEKEKF